MGNESDNNQPSSEEPVAEDPFQAYRAEFDELRRQAGMPPAPARGPAPEPQREITSWQDIIEDDDWLTDSDDDSDDSDTTATPGLPFDVPDIAGEVYNALSAIFSQPTHDFEIHYQRGHRVFDDARTRLSELAQQAQAAGISPDDPRAEPLDEQVSRVREWNEEHISRHDEYRKLMNPVTGKYGKAIADADRKAAAENLKIIEETNAVVAGTFADIREANLKAAAKRNSEWLKAFQGRRW